ncbi:MAG TPA: hypothetical protein VLQ93_15500 [Myxococcaceae bacterium]|nr:hypothetical protein [Myxococcaceae bacterium]
MRVHPYRRVLLGLMGVALGCTSPNPNVRVRRLQSGRLQVQGPLAGPFKTLEELAENACELMTSQPGAANGVHGFEYCALHYYSQADDAFFLSYLSDVRGRADSAEKSCSLPTELDDPNHEDALILGGNHTHPHNRQFSPRDLSVWAHWNPTRLVDKSTGRVWDRNLMLFFRESTGECRSYSYNNTTRVVSALRGGEWVAIGKVYDDFGNIRMFDGMDWLP